MDFVIAAAAACKFVVPYLAKLKERTHEAAGKKVGEFVVDKSLDAAKGLWNTLRGWFRDDQKFIKLSDYLEADPSDEDSQQTLVKELAKRLEIEPARADELKSLLGGEKAMNSLVVGQEAEVEKIRQRIRGFGENLIKSADKSKLKDIEQEINID
jgi:hypothetical protein